MLTLTREIKSPMEGDKKMRKRPRLAPVTLLLAAVVLLTANCGSDADTDADDGAQAEDGGEGAQTDDGAQAEDGFKVGLVFDVGGEGDQSFNDSAVAGIERAAEELGIAYTKATPNPDGSDREELLRLAAEDSDIVIAVGFLFGRTP